MWNEEPATLVNDVLRVTSYSRKPPMGQAYYVSCSIDQSSPTNLLAISQTPQSNPMPDSRQARQ